MRDLIGEFETYLIQDKKASSNTISSYLRDIRKFNDYLYQAGVKHLDQATHKIVTSYIESMPAAGKSPSTVTRTLASLRCFYNFLVYIDIADSNPTKGIAAAKPEKKLPQILTSAEVDLLLKQPECNSLKGLRDKAMLEVLYATGIRVTELIDLNINHVNLELGFVICVAGERERMIPLYATAVTALSEYIRKARKILVNNAAEKALFVNLNGERMTRQGFWKIVKHYQEQANIHKEITPHTLRHSFAAHLLQNGADLKSIQEMLGHADISSTQVYAQLIKVDLRNTYNKFHPRA